MGFALSDMQLRSPAFDAGGMIPKEHTGEGEDVSPPFSWSQVPQGTKSFALICHDPDAPLIKAGQYGYVHWLLYNVPGDNTSLEQDTSVGDTGKNDFDRDGYGGPMPPEGHGPHHYFFWLLALDREPNLPKGLTLGQLLNEIEPHVLGMNRLVGRYQRG